MARLTKDPCPGFEKLDGEGWEDHHRRQERLLEEVRGRGTVLQFPVADGYAMYLVVSEKPLTLQHVPFCDGYQVSAATIRGVTMREVEQQRERDRQDAVRHAAAEAFYSSLSPGQVVHYHNGFGAFVRCEAAVEDGRTVLKEVALVGEWREFDLPHRARDGSVQMGYHADGVIEGRTFRPHPSCVYESSDYVRGPFEDPRGKAPIRLEPPGHDGEEAREAALWRKVEAAAAILSRAQDPADAIRRAMGVLGAA